MIESRIRDEIAYLHGARRSIFYITGNPGLISYYARFLRTLNDRLNDSVPQGNRVNIYGRSLAGFEVEPEHEQQQLFSLQDQIRFVEGNLVKFADAQRHQTGQRPEILIMGHSVGTYIALEVLRRYNEVLESSGRSFDITLGVLLFPTIVDIAKSPSGQRVGWVAQSSWTPWILSSIAHGLARSLPGDLLLSLVKRITGMPDDSAAVTTAFVRSKLGVEQACFMGRDELNEMTDDRWQDEIWGAEGAPANTKLFFYFGRNDHWIAEDTRKSIIARRGRTDANTDSWKPLMQVDELGISHSFSLQHSDVIANRVADYLLGMSK